MWEFAPSKCCMYCLCLCTAVHNFMHPDCSRLLKVFWRSMSWGQLEAAADEPQVLQSRMCIVALDADNLRVDIINCCYGHSSSRWQWQGSCDRRTPVLRYGTHWPHQYQLSCSAVMARKATSSGECRLVPTAVQWQSVACSVATAALCHTSSWYDAYLIKLWDDYLCLSHTNRHDLHSEKRLTHAGSNESRWVSDAVNCLWTGWQADERADRPVSGCVWRGQFWQGGRSTLLWERVATVDMEQQHQMSSRTRSSLRLWRAITIDVLNAFVCLHWEISNLVLTFQ
jgi:hypothetical protein